MATARARQSLAPLSGGFGMGFQQVFVFLVPLRASELGASLTVVGLALAAGSLAPLVLSIPLGTITDRIGARRGFILGAGVSAVLSGGFLLVGDIATLLALQLLLGSFRTLAWIASQSYIASFATAGAKTDLTGRFSAAAHAGVIAGPALAGLAAQVMGLRLAFAIPVAFALCFVLLGLAMPEQPRRPSPVTSGAAERHNAGLGLGTAWRLLGDGRMRYALLTSFVRLWLNVLWSGFFPLFLVGQGVGTGIAGVVTASRSAVATLVSLSMGRLIARLNVPLVVAVVLTIEALAVAVSPYFAWFPAFFVPTAVIGVCVGVAAPLLLVLIRSSDVGDDIGVAFGMRTSANQAANVLGPTVAGPLMTVVGVALGLGVGASLGAGILLLGYARSRRVRRAEHA